MPSLPRKARNGDDFKSYTTSAINKLIDYLHSMRPKDSPDIKVKESASGLMFELANRPKMTPQVASTGGGGGGSGLFPSYISGENTVFFDVGYDYTADQDCWLLGSIYISHSYFDSTVPDFKIRYRNNDNNNIVYDAAFNMMLTRESSEIWFPVCVPMPANKVFYIQKQVGVSSSIGCFFHAF
jgi:hypothetical protein